MMIVVGGINTITPCIKCLCSLAGFTNGKFCNQSGQSSSCTRMFNGNQSTQVIKSVSGHVSNAVETYNRISDKMRRQDSATIQGPIVSNDKKESSSADEFEDSKVKLVTPSKCNLESCEHECDAKSV